MITQLFDYGPILGAWSARRGIGMSLERELFGGAIAAGAQRNAKRHRIGSFESQTPRPKGAVGECPRSSPA